MWVCDEGSMVGGRGAVIEGGKDKRGGRERGVLDGEERREEGDGRRGEEKGGGGSQWRTRLGGQFPDLQGIYRENGFSGPCLAWNDGSQPAEFRHSRAQIPYSENREFVA